MIKRIFQDLDECILYTLVDTVPHEGEEYVEFKLENDTHTYRTIIRPCAKQLFEYYNSVVGKENVYILTTATRDYAHILNRLGEFGLDEDHIFTREDIKQHTITLAYEGEGMIKLPIADKENVLIDNLPPRYNTGKTDMMGIIEERYYQTPEYYGNNLDEAHFLAGIKKFIESKR